MLKKIIFFFACIYLAGCSFQSTQPHTPNISPISWEEHQSMLRNFLNWELSGKVGIRTQESTQSASLAWLQKQQHYQIDIHGPWGQGGASITGQPGDITVNASGGKQFKGANPELILYNALGWELPINDIYWWIRGLPSPEAPFTHSLENNRLKSLQQRGWNIQYIRYNTRTPALPSKIHLIRNELKITVVVNSWIKR